MRPSSPMDRRAAVRASVCRASFHRRIKMVSCREPSTTFSRASRRPAESSTYCSPHIWKSTTKRFGICLVPTRRKNWNWRRAPIKESTSPNSVSIPFRMSLTATNWCRTAGRIDPSVQRSWTPILLGSNNKNFNRFMTRKNHLKRFESGSYLGLTRSSVSL